MTPSRPNNIVLGFVRLPFGLIFKHTELNYFFSSSSSNLYLNVTNTHAIQYVSEHVSIEIII